MENRNNKKTIGIIVAVILALIVVGVFGFMLFNSSAKNKTLSKGVQAIEAKEYNKALAIYDIALESDNNNEEAKRYRDIILDYLDSKKAYDDGDYKKANEIIEKITSEYSKFSSLKEDVDSLKESINKNIKDSDSVDKNIEKIREDINKGNFKAANNLISSIYKENLTGAQKDTILDLKGRVESEISRQEADLKNKEESKKENLVNAKSRFLNKLAKIQDVVGRLPQGETTLELKKRASDEYKLWDNELNVIYNYLKDNLSQSDFNKLEKEEVQWIKEKETKAKDAMNEVKGGSLEGVFYLSSIAAQTKDRCYELVNNYM